MSRNGIAADDLRVKSGTISARKWIYTLTSTEKPEKHSVAIVSEARAE